VQSVGLGWWQHGVLGEELPDVTSQTADALMLYELITHNDRPQRLNEGDN